MCPPLAGVGYLNDYLFVRENKMNTSPPADHDQRLARAKLCLEGLSVGDAFGERFFFQSTMSFLLQEKAMPAPPWRITDDTIMALSICEVLEEHGGIHQDDLARRFAARYKQDPNRGYGRGAIQLLEDIHRGEPWREATAQLFYGEGSKGNGSAMRVGPVGAYFADDYQALIEHAVASAEVTHANLEAKAGAIAVALAVACAWQLRETDEAASPDVVGRDLLEFVLEHTPPSETADGLAEAAKIPLNTPPRSAAGVLGNGDYVLCSDTVPFCIWSAARNLTDFPTAMWDTVSVHGDMDTNCAIVGGIVAMTLGEKGLPTDWVDSRESLYPE